jgi:hypothetical protein
VARVILASYMVRYPLGGMTSYVLQYLLGLQRLGHDVYFVEKSGYPTSCYDPTRNEMTSDCTYGVRTIHELLTRFGLERQFCYVDEQQVCHGMSREQVNEVFRTADLFIEMGGHEAWLEESSWCRSRITLDGDPGFNQIWLDQRRDSGQPSPRYDGYFTVGMNVGTAASSAPTAGETWQHHFHPVMTDLFSVAPADPTAPFTTVLNWESYKSVEYKNTTYGHKNIEFEKFIDLPSRSGIALEAAVGGSGVPWDRLARHGWIAREGRLVTQSVDRFWEYIRGSRGEFTVCKNGFVALRTGWFSDRSAAYLASGRPVIMQDTGIRAHLPCGAGLLAVDSVEDAAEALADVNGNWEEHSKAARSIAVEFLDSPKVMADVLAQAGI